MRRLQPWPGMNREHELHKIVKCLLLNSKVNLNVNLKEYGFIPHLWKKGYDENFPYFAPMPVVHKFTVDTLEEAFQKQLNFSFEEHFLGYNGMFYDFDINHPDKLT